MYLIYSLLDLPINESRLSERDAGRAGIDPSKCGCPIRSIRFRDLTVRRVSVTLFLAATIEHRPRPPQNQRRTRIRAEIQNLNRYTTSAGISATMSHSGTTVSPTSAAMACAHKHDGFSNGNLSGPDSQGPAASAKLRGESSSSALPASAAMNSLPPELLSHIFWYIPRLSDDIHAPAPPWANLLHVCARWREISLQYADLWTLIPLGNMYWTSLALELSQTRPVHIHCPNSVLPHHREPIKLAMMHAQRASSLSLRTLRSDTSDMTTQTDWQDTIFLRSLRNNPPTELTTLFLAGISLMGPGDTLYHDGILPALSKVCKLEFSHCSLPSTFTFPPTLASLRLDDVFFARWSFAELAGALNRLPRLQELALIDLDTQKGLQRLSDVPSIQLPNVHTLSVKDTIDALSIYMRSFRIWDRGDFSLRVICTESVSKGVLLGFGIDISDCYDPLFAILGKYLHGVAAQCHLDISFSTGPTGPFAQLDVANVHIGIEAWERLDLSMLASLFPETAREATLTCDVALPSPTWAAIIGRACSYLRCIILPSFECLSKFPLINKSIACPDMSSLREIAFTEPQNMIDGPSFSQLLCLLQETTATVYFEVGTRFERDQISLLVREYPGRIFVAE